MKIQTYYLGPMQTGCYLIEKENEYLIIDPGFYTEELNRVFLQKGMKKGLVINTHGHADHIGGNGPIKINHHGAISIHEQDAEMLTDPQKNLSSFLGESFISPPADNVFKEGETIAFHHLQLKVLHTPGHTPGSCCLWDEEGGVLFTGDTLFDGGRGRTDLPGGDETKLLLSLQRLRSFPGDMRCYPGHGPSFILKDQFEMLDFIIGS
ncbi:MAG TPA: MBL fold metallo-hydrolase [Firmicutes bacterium]|nr:MBL fold metallo-hydrolase [Bacillota bacterium]